MGSDGKHWEGSEGEAVTKIGHGVCFEPQGGAGGWSLLNQGTQSLK